MDTNVISDYLSEKLPIAGLDFIDKIIDESNPNISVMTRIEMLSYMSPMAEKIRSFASASNVYHLSEPIIVRTIALRRSRRIKIPDAIIAATALVHDLTLITHNTADFEGIPALKLLDAYEL